MGPSVVSGSVLARWGMRPVEGLTPTAPQSEAGTRMEPPPSEPQATGATPAAVEAAAPPLEPPAARAGSHGVPVVPVSLLSVTPRNPNSGVVVLPSRIVPASLSRDQAAASLSGTWSA